MINLTIQKIYRTIKSVLNSSSLEDTDTPTNFSLIDSFRRLIDPFRYNNLEDKDTRSNFSLIDAVKNHIGTHLVAFPGAGWLFDNFIETCVTCGTWIPF